VSVGSPTLRGVRELLGSAREVYAGTEWEPVVVGLVDRLDEPLRVAIAGKVKAGKSTLLNALVGEPLAPTDAGECTRIVTWYREGLTYRTTLHPRTGAPRQVHFERSEGAVVIDLEGFPVDEVAQLTVEWPSSALRAMTLIDTPGLGSLSADAGARTQEMLAPEDEPSVADAVLYLMRHVHHGDVRFLEAFRDDTASGTPVNAIAVLSRADEVGGARLDALESAARIAERYRADPAVRRVCHTVVPVAGLVAQASSSLTEAEYRSLVRLAGSDPAVLDEMLQSVDRVVDPELTIGVSDLERRHLLDRLGLFGLRFALDVISSGGARSSRELADALRAASGITRLREVLTRDVVSRRDLLKARTALVGLDRLLAARPVHGSDALVGRLEALTASSHEVAELRLLTAVRSGVVVLADEQVVEVERVLSGGTVVDRLGLGPEAGAADVRALAGEGALRWRRRAEFAATPKSVRDAAAVLVRSYEGMLAELDTT
jgi:hypothetical protein